MSKPLNILLVEDSEDDALLIIREMRRGGYEPLHERVETAEAMAEAFGRKQWDLVISDYLMPKFSGLQALELYKKAGQDVPFIIVSGNIGEDIAVGAMKAGAHDYIVKGSLGRLVPAVERELRDVRARSARKQAEAALRKQSLLLEAFFRHTITPLVFLDRSFNFIRVNDAYARSCGRQVSDFEGRNHFVDYPSDELKEEFERAVETKQPYCITARPFAFPDHPEWGVSYWDLNVTPILDDAGEVDFLIFSLHDVTERVKAQQRSEVTNSLLLLYAQKLERDEYLDAAVELLRRWTGCGHAGIRVTDRSGNIPFAACKGYSEVFLATERALSLSEDNCICTRVSVGTPEPQDLSAMTEEGAFYSNNTIRFIEQLGPGKKARYRGHCMQNGYKSLAVIPIRYRGRVIGAIHLADEREGMVPLEKVTFLETLARIIGEAILRFEIEDELRENYNALQRTTELLERIFSTTHMLIAYLDRNFNFIRVNRAYAASNNREPESFIGRNYFELCPDEEVRAIFRKVAESGEPHQALEHAIGCLKHTEAEVRFWDWNLTPVKESDGSVNGLVFTLVDVTDRKRAQEELRRASAYNRSLIESSLDPLVTIAPDGKITDVNAAAETATGRLRDELIGTDFSEYFTEPAKARAVHLQAFREGKVMDYALDILHSDGHTTPVLYNASLYRDEAGRTRGIFAAARDVTELKKAEEERARLASAVESTADAVVITDAVSGEIQYVNPAFEQITGYTKNEALGRTIHFLDSGRHDGEFFEKLRNSLMRDGVWRGQLINVKKDGSLYFEDCTFSPVRSASGKIINFVSVKRDVTEKLRLESIAESVNMMNNIGYIFSGVRHEIGNPINSAKMALSVLHYKLEQASKDFIKEYLDRALAEIGRVERLLKNLKNYNLYEKTDLQNLDLTSFLEEFLNLISADLRKNNVALRKELSPDAGWTFADPRIFHQVLINIITNAVDALSGKDAPQISISAVKLPGRVLVRIEDNGCGMSEKQQQELFKPFYTSKSHGTGLGLVLVKRMLSRINGEIRITSRKNEGTVVDIYLPEGRNAAQQ
ncbi:MAG TPA: PAS domain S-box protein [Nitrospirota bacterium]